ncbi:MAG: aconitate hydratase [Bacillota bacterium]|nr:aconitate hydratase [Bacillota bacterium]
MGLTLSQKIIRDHLLTGDMIPGQEIGIRIDQTLTQDSTGTMAYLQFEALGLDRVQTELSVAYVDHNMLQASFESADDHLYLQSVAARYGIRFSRPGNGICHQVHYERFAVPGKTLLGSDSHTPTAGGLGMLAIGAGGLDVAVAMGGGAYYTAMPRMIRVRLEGRLTGWASAKDIILELLRRLSVKGGVGKIVEYDGPGLAYLSIPERATITNMGAELGATTSIFPSDEVTRDFMTAQGRGEDWVALAADPDAVYDEEYVIQLDELEPLVAWPHSPDSVHTVAETARKRIRVDQVTIGSCTNSSFVDMMKVARMLRGRTVAPHVSLVIGPGSKQVLNMIARNGALADIIAAGARILEAGCGPCIGMGQAPPTNGISVRTINRNFQGRSGTASASVYLVSPETAVATALMGYIADPAELDMDVPVVEQPEAYQVNDNMIIMPPEDGAGVEILRGPNIKPLPPREAMTDPLAGEVLIKVGDNITTDHIMPSNASLLPYRSNVPHLANYCLTPCDPEFPARARAKGGGIIVAGQNYGQGSSREHAALAPVELGVRAVVAQGFARIHKANLINNGILPLTLANAADYEDIELGDELELADSHEQVGRAVDGGELVLRNLTRGRDYLCTLEISPRQRDMLLAGGLLADLARKRR